MTDLPPPPPPPEEGPLASPGGPRPSGLPYPAFPPEEKTDLPEAGPGSPGSILPRVGARLIDVLLLSFPFLLLGQRYVETTADNTIIDNRPGWLLILASIVPIVYEFWLLAWRGQTIGKMLLKLQVVRYADGDHIHVFQAAIRTLVPALPGIIAIILPLTIAQFVSLIGIAIYLSAIFDPVYRGIHDKAAGTIVLRTNTPQK